MSAVVEKGHILLVGNFLGGKGSRQVCEDLAEQLTATGWQVYTTSARKARVWRFIDMLYTVWRLRKNYQIAQIDVFSGLSFAWAEAVATLLALLQKPFVLTLHGGNLPSFSQQHSQRVVRLLKRATVVTVPSKFLLNEMQPYRSDLLLLANPVDLSSYAFHLRSVTKPNFVWLRAFAETYNPALAADVIAELRGEFPNICLTMIGPDKGDGTLQKFQAKVARLGIASSVVLLGSVAKSDVPQLLLQGDLFLNTTNVDNTPISVIEAMACGLCVVSTNVGGIPYLLEHEQDALLVPPDDAPAMAQAVRRILTEPGLAERLSRNARAKAERFDWSLILPQWEKLLSDGIGLHQHG